MTEREEIIERIKVLSDDDLKAVQDLIDDLEKRRREAPGQKDDLLVRVIGVCEGPPDLAEKHDKYVYR
jgi:hypothetical protein